MQNFNDNITKLKDLPDGSSIYDVALGLPTVVEQPTPPTNNLAINFPEAGLKKLSQFILDNLEEDIKARSASREFIRKIYPYLGLDLESGDPKPFPNASRTFDTTLSTALIRYLAIACSEILGSDNLVDFKIKGQRNPDSEARAEKLKDWFNYFLTIKDRGWRADAKICFIYTGLEGSGYKKVYYDPITKQAKSRFILPEDFLVDMDCTSILESNRLTHILKHYKREILLNQQSGVYRDVELPYLTSLSDEIPDDEMAGQQELSLDPAKDTSDFYTKKSTYNQYEVHTYIDLSEFKSPNIDASKSSSNIPRPYIITIDRITKEVLSIYDNTSEDNIKPKEEFFVQYNYLPGFGVNGIGLANLIGTNAMSSTKMLRQIIDAASFQNLPGGLRNKGLKSQTNDLTIGPGQFVEVDAGSMPLKDMFMPLPYNGPSQALREVRIEVNNASKELASTSEMGMLESKEDIPTSTMLVALEQNNRIQSAVLKALYEAFSHELQLLYKVFKRTIVRETFVTDSGTYEITGEDFTDDIEIIPATDPSVNSSVQRMMRAGAVMSTAMQLPDFYNMPEVLRMNHKAQGLDEQTIDAILKPIPEPEEIQPVDPITGVTNFLLGKPYKAFPWQNHPAYILVYGVAGQRPEFRDKPEQLSALQAGVTEHEALQYWNEMQQLMGTEIPLDQLQNPQMQNAIASGLANALEDSGATQPPPTPEDTLREVGMAEVQQKAAQVEAKERSDTQRIEAEMTKAGLQSEQARMKIEADLAIAEMKTKSAEDIAILKAEQEAAKLQLEAINTEIKGSSAMLEELRMQVEAMHKDREMSHRDREIENSEREVEHKMKEKNIGNAE